MKTIVVATILAIHGSFTYAQKIQEKDVPLEVKSAFIKQHPTVKSASWEKEKNNFEVEFEIKEIEHSIVYDASGNLLETEVEISIDELPAQIKDYVNKNYSGQKIKAAAKITDSKGAITFEAEIKGKDLLFDAQGNFVQEIRN